MKKSELYKIIKEEVEVILTNEEMEEVFDLDVSILLDEMMDEAARVPPQTIMRKNPETGETDPQQQMTVPGYSLTGDETEEERKQKEASQDEPLEKWQRVQGLKKESELTEKKKKRKKKKKKDPENWIKGAVKKSHKGYCTPMTKKTCTPPRKRLAKIFKGPLRQANLKRGKNPHGPG